MGTRGRVFADEAYRLLQQERAQPQPSLTLTQGVALLWTYESNIGDGPHALRLLDDVYHLYSTFSFQRPQGYETLMDPPLSLDLRVRRATAHLAWGLYIITA